MNERILAVGALAAGLSLAACGGSDSNVEETQSADTPESTAVALTYPSGEPHPMTEWGDPDLQGTWPIQHLIGTPFQRSEEYGTREELTEEEYLAQAEQLEEGRNARYEEEINSNKMGMGHWAETTEAQRITSLLVDPPNGRFPELTERGKELATQMGSSWSTEASGEGFDSVADFDTWDRCITRGLPPSMFPFNYNNGIRIHQAPGYVVIELEMIHEARIVPVDGRPPLASEIKQWMGESRGHWDRATLVVETTNFNGFGGMTNVGIPGSPRGDTPTTTGMKITERFTRVGDDQINYSMTVEDPEVLTSSWTARYPMYRDEEYAFFEYACHEDNTAVRNFIETSRHERAQAAPGGE
jgi:hypothetical protein